TLERLDVSGFHAHTAAPTRCVRRPLTAITLSGHEPKYGAKRTEFGGRVYDSKPEAGVASDIELLRKSGEVVKVEPQRTFNLRQFHAARQHVAQLHRLPG